MKGESARVTVQKAVRRRLLTGAVTGIVLTTVFGIVSVLATAGGHGTYVPTALFFPGALLLAIEQAIISRAALLLAAAQWPLYGAVVGLAASGDRMVAAITCLTVLHATLVVACFLLDRCGQYL